MGMLTDDSPVLNEVFERLKPTLFALLDADQAFGALAVMSVHAQEVGADILRPRDVVYVGKVINR